MQRLHVSIRLAYSALLNFLIRSQLTAEIGGIAVVRAYPETGGINTRVGIAVREGIGALSSIYSGGVCE